MSPEANPPPGRWLRGLYRAPLALYRHGGAGWEAWIGWRWILVITRGRKTGREHAVLLDLIGQNQNDERFFVQAAYGRRADWVLNAEAAGELEAQVGRRRFVARMEWVADEEARRVMRAYV